jgi:hypothetical protein
MLADLRWRRDGALPFGDGPRDRLLRGYGLAGAQGRARAGIYEAVFLLKAAARRASLLDPGWEQVVDAAVGDAARLVAAGQGRTRARTTGGVPA